MHLEKCSRLRARVKLPVIIDNNNGLRGAPARRKGGELALEARKTVARTAR